jgi:hypothetical protein
MGPVLGVVDDRYAGGATSRRPHLVRTPHFAPTVRSDLPNAARQSGRLPRTRTGEARLQIFSPHHQHEGRPTQVLGFWCYRITDENALLPA